MDANADRTLKRRFIQDENKKKTNQLLYTASHTHTHSHIHTHTQQDAVSNSDEVRGQTAIRLSGPITERLITQRNKAGRRGNVITSFQVWRRVMLPEVFVEPSAWWVALPWVQPAGGRQCETRGGQSELRQTSPEAPRPKTDVKRCYLNAFISCDAKKWDPLLSMLHEPGTSNTTSPDSINKRGDFKSCWVKTNFLM